MRDPRKERSVFLERQMVRRRRRLGRRLRQVERVLLSVAIVLAGLALFYGVYALVVLGDSFAVRAIAVGGDRRVLSAQEVADLSAVQEGEGLFRVSVGGVHERLRANSWVKSAAVQRQLPNTLSICVEEYRPQAIATIAEGLAYVDADGTFFKPLETSDDKTFPVVSGLEGLPPEEASAKAREMLSLLAAFRESDFGKEREVAEVHADALAGYSLVTQRDSIHILFGHAAFAEGLARLGRLQGALLAHAGRIQYMLVHEPGRVVVRYREGTSENRPSAALPANSRSSRASPDAAVCLRPLDEVSPPCLLRSLVCGTPCGWAVLRGPENHEGGSAGVHERIGNWAVRSSAHVLMRRIGKGEGDG